MKETITIQEVASQLGMSPQGVRIQLQRGILPFGVAVPSVQGNRKRYIIPREKFNEFMGVKNGERKY